MDERKETPTILLLERDADVIQVAERVLRREFELHVAGSVDLAVRIAERRPVIIAVLDATMTGLDPADTVASLRAHRPDLRIIFLAMPSVVLDRRYGQIGPVLRKPITAERFGEAIRYAVRFLGMSAGIQQMRKSSGTFRALRPDARPTPSEPPPSSDRTR
jgi:DNA-binding response OmpR family regulator